MFAKSYDQVFHSFSCQSIYLEDIMMYMYVWQINADSGCFCFHQLLVVGGFVPIIVTVLPFCPGYVYTGCVVSFRYASDIGVIFG